MTSLEVTPQVAHQLDLEQEMRALGIARYQKARETADEATLPPGVALVQKTMGKVAAAIREWIGFAHHH